MEINVFVTRCNFEGKRFIIFCARTKLGFIGNASLTFLSSSAKEDYRAK